MNRLRKMYRLQQLPEFYDRPGHRVAVMDSGIALHPDLKQAVYGYYDFTKDGNGGFDRCGHGTHIAGIIGGNGFLSGGTYGGIHKGVELISLRVLDQNGNGSIESMCDAFEWLLEYHKAFHIRVVNMSVSLNPAADKEKQRTLYEAIRKLSMQKVILVTASGNSASQTIHSVAAMPQVITAGCYDADCRGKYGSCCQDYSGAGFCSKDYCKPDVLAPGTAVMSCDGLWTQSGKYYCRKSGTSMAAAVISGAVSLLLTYRPDFSLHEIRQCFLRSRKKLPMRRSQQGYGMLDIPALLKSAELT